ncbi:MAG TPA: lamin tail domain-containing protein, partial [Phycisphaerae bacterium]|nr:lamin tail domain-containing protein [Phycisphaerae bacterium]
GIGILTDGFGPDQVVLWTGANHLSDQGFVVRWSEIDPGLDGEFEIVSQQYTGAIPTEVDPGGVAGGNKGYGLNAVRLIEGHPFGAPEVVNVPATEVGPFSARLGGEILVTGGEAPNVTLYYGDHDGGTDPGLWDHAVDLGPCISDFSTVVGGLDSGTPYYFRTFARNSFDSAWAPASEAFVTTTVSAPSVANRPATNVGAFSAWLNGEVTDTGNDPPLVTVYYGASDGGTDPGAWEKSAEVGAQSAAFAAMVTDLEPETTYYFTAYARNAVGSAWATPSRLLTTGTPPPIEISEFMADNATTLTTRTRATTGEAFVGDTDSPDWIEIHNPTDAPAVLGGFHLTDDLLSPEKWEFPAGTVVPAYGYLVVFASGDDITDPALDQNGYLHTNFKLADSGGEDVAVTDADGTLVWAYVDYPPQTEDTSYGVDDLGEERFYPAPTPGWDNANAVPQAPVFSVASTTFTGSIVVDLAPRYPTDTIRYTTNETLPTAYSPIWPGPMTVSNTTMIRAVAIGAGGRAGRVVSETYVELGADFLDDNTNLPIVIVEMFGDSMPGSHQPFGDCFIAIIEPGEDGRTYLTDPFDLTTRGGIHIRGSSSAGFYKKQYRVELWDESNEDQQLDVLGMPAEADWIFYGPGPYDRALINNPLVYDLSNQVGQYATRTRWVEMYLNAGGGQLSGNDYYGIYAIIEVVEQADDRLDIDDLSTGAGGVPVDGGFAWKNDRGAPYVEPEDPTTAQRTYIDAYINATEAAAVSSNFRDPDVGYAAYIDVDSFIDHNLLNMLPMNVDAFRLSGYYYKIDEDGKLIAGPVWDFDRTLESTDGRDNNPTWWNGTGDSTRFFNDDVNYGDRCMRWWSRVFDDPDFVQMYIDRWFELRETVFSLAGIYATIDAHAAELAEAAPRDYARWQASRYGNFAGEIQHMKDWLTTRINWIDSQWLARPTTNVPGPVVTPGTTVTLHGSTGDVWYTTDGTDPRAPGGGISGSAVRATGAIPINQYTKITARVYRPGHTPSSGEPGYIPTGDDWSAPTVTEYFVNPLVASGDLVITEMNYHPHDATPQELAGQPPADPDFEDNDFEFVEFMNTSGHAVNIAGVHFTDAVTFAFDSHILAPGDRVVVAEDLDGFTARYGINGSLVGTGITLAGVWAGELNNGGELATVAARDGSGLLNFAYDDTAAWPGRADGKGAALQLIDPWAVPATEPARQAFLENPDNWQSSNRYGGSPGAEDDPDITVVVNEVLTHTDEPLADAVELHNTSTTDPVDISGWWLSDSWGWDWSIQNGDYKKFLIPDGTVLGPGEYRVFDEGHYVGGALQFHDDEFGYGVKGFGLDSAHGDDVWLMKADAQGNLTHFVDHVEFGAAANGESFGRWPDGTGDLYPMAARTLPGPNAGPRIGPLLISEVHYHPTAGENLEFIEIYNPAATPVNLWETWFVDGQWQDYPWKVEGFDFAVGTTLAAGEALVVVPFDPDDAQLLGDFKCHYGLVGSSVQIVGPYDDPLDD